MRGPAVLNPFAPPGEDTPVRRVRELTGVFPGARFLALGATEEEVAESREHWNALTAEDQAIAAAALDRLTDDELREAIESDRLDEAGLTAEERAELAQLAAWAEGTVATGRYEDFDQALNDVDDLADAIREAALRGEEVDLDALAELHTAALVGVPEPPPELTEGGQPAEPETTTPGSTEGDEATGGSGTTGAEGEASADDEPAGAQPATEDGYPADGGTIASVLGWVGAEGADSRARAQVALDAELARDEKDQRAGILGPLRKIIGD